MTTTNDLKLCEILGDHFHYQECAFYPTIKLASGEIVANNISSDDPW